jgi:hypothetical protein
MAFFVTQTFIRLSDNVINIGFLLISGHSGNNSSKNLLKIETQSSSIDTNGRAEHAIVRPCNTNKPRVYFIIIIMLVNM